MDKYTACFGRYEIEELVPPENSVLISIRDPNSVVPHTQPGAWKVVHYTAFWDVEKVLNWHMNTLHPATDEQLKNIHAFIQEHKDKHIFAHCEAGVSRSAAIREYLRSRGWLYWGNNGLREVFPNGYVLSRLERLDYPERKYQ